MKLEVILKRYQMMIDGKYLFTDTTSLEKNIVYPTEVSILSRVIQEAEVIIQKVAHNNWAY